MSAISSYKITIIPVYQTSALAAHTIQTNSLCLDHLNYKYTQLKPLHKEDWRLLHAFPKRETTSTIYKYLITESNKLMVDLHTETMVPCIVCATYVLLCIKELYYINSMCTVDIKSTCKFNDNLATHSYANSSSTVKHILLLKVLKCWVSCGLQIELCQCLSVTIEDKLIKGDGEVELNTHPHTIW